jgi:hypothetical protein
MTGDNESARLDELDEIEFYDVARVFKPEITREEFHDMWVEFQAEKAKFLAQRSLS